MSKKKNIFKTNEKDNGGIYVAKIEKLGKKSAKRKLILSAVSMLLFFFVLIFFDVMTIFSPKREFSELENRYLEDPPEISFKGIMDGSFEEDCEDYLADHFYNRDKLLKFKTYANLALRTKERNGVYITDKCLAERVKEPDPKALESTVAGIADFADANSEIPVYFMLAPTSGDIYYDEMPSNAPMLDEKKFIDSVYDSLGDKVTPIDVYSSLSLNKDSYIYYRTDHHWTSYGAYLGYSAAAKKMGFTALPYDAYDIEHASDDFRGTLYSKALYDGVKPDVIDLYHPKDGAEIKGEYVYKDLTAEPVFYDTVYFRSYLQSKDKYSVYTGENNPLIKMVSDSDGGRLLIIKDSYAHSCAPFFLQNYSEVTMLDMRYVNISYTEAVNVPEYDAVLFLYNVSTFSQDEHLKKLSMG